MVNCKCNILAPFRVRVRPPAFLDRAIDLLISSSLTHSFHLRMDCIYLSQKFGRPLVRWFYALVVFVSTAHSLLSSLMIHGKKHSLRRVPGLMESAHSHP